MDAEAQRKRQIREEKKQQKSKEFLLGFDEDAQIFDPKSSLPERLQLARAKVRNEQLATQQLEDSIDGIDQYSLVRSKFSSGGAAFDDSVDEALLGCRNKEDIVNNFLADLLSNKMSIDTKRFGIDMNRFGIDTSKPENKMSLAESLKFSMMKDLKTQGLSSSDKVQPLQITSLKDHDDYGEE